MATASRNALSVLFFELNEAERYFLDKFAAEGRLPNFARAAGRRRVVRTRVPGWDASRGEGVAHDQPVDHLAVGLHRA